MATYPAKYMAKIWNDDEGVVKTVTGITFAENFTEAMANIESYYGDEMVEVTIELFEECTIYEFSPVPAITPQE